MLNFQYSKFSVFNTFKPLFNHFLFPSYLLMWDPIKHLGERNGSIGNPSLFTFTRSQSIEDV